MSKPGMNAMFGGETKGGFFGLPTAAPGDVKDADIVLLGAPCATPYPLVGPYCADAPDAVRSAFGWPGVLEHHDFDICGPVLSSDASMVDWGNLSYSLDDFPGNRKEIKKQVRTVIDSSAIPIIIGGDDSIPIPVLEAYEGHGPITVLQLDAHIDWRYQVGGETMGLSSNMRRASEMPWIENIIQIGARGIGSARPSDLQDALEWGVKFFPMREIVRNGLAPVVDAIAPDCNLFITFDIDVMDPTVVPGVIGPAPGGMNYWQLVEILEAASDRAKIVGFDLVEFMPANDIGGRSALIAARTIAIMMGLISRSKKRRTT